MSDSITLNISANVHERVIKHWLQDTLRQFNSGDLSLNQTRDLIMGYFERSSDETKSVAEMAEFIKSHQQQVANLLAEIDRLRAAPSPS